MQKKYDVLAHQNTTTQQLLAKEIQQHHVCKLELHTLQTTNQAQCAEIKTLQSRALSLLDANKIFHQQLCDAQERYVCICVRMCMPMNTCFL